MKAFDLAALDNVCIFRYLINTLRYRNHRYLINIFCSFSSRYPDSYLSNKPGFLASVCINFNASLVNLGVCVMLLHAHSLQRNGR